jgi:hypothetical protein
MPGIDPDLRSAPATRHGPRCLRWRGDHRARLPDPIRHKHGAPEGYWFWRITAPGRAHRSTPGSADASLRHTSGCCRALETTARGLSLPREPASFAEACFARTRPSNPKGGVPASEPPARAAVALVARRATAGLITLDWNLEAPAPIKGLASGRGLSHEARSLLTCGHPELTAERA